MAQRTELDEKNEALAIAEENEKKARLAAANMEQRAEEYRKALEEEKFKNVSTELLDEKKRELEEQKRIISQCDSDIRILKGRLALAERNKDSKRLELLNKRNAELSEKLAAASALEESLKKQLQELAENSCDKKSVEALTKKLERTEKELEELKAAYKKAKDEYSEKKKHEAPIASDFDDLLEEMKPYMEINSRIDEVEYRITDANAGFFRRFNHRCGCCGKRLRVSKNHDRWYCPNFENSQRCKGSGKRMTFSEMEQYKELLELYDEKAGLVKEKENWVRKNRPEIKKPDYAIKADKGLLNSRESSLVEYRPYSFADNSGLRSAVFQSLCVPSELFKSGNICSDELCKFRVWYSEKLTEAAKTGLSDKQSIYSLVLRLLIRGKLISLNEDIAGRLRSRFCKKSFGKLSDLAEYAKDDKAWSLSEKSIQKRFAAMYFPKLFKTARASYISSDIALKELCPELVEKSQNYEKLKIDFCISGYSKELKPLLISIDIYGSNNSALSRETVRNELRKAGFEIMCFSSKQIEENDPAILEALKAYFDIEDIVVDTDSRYLLACKLQHQIAIAIASALEKGYVSEKCAFDISINTDMFSYAEQKFILDLAVYEIEELIGKYTEIYDVDFELDLSDASSEKVNIYIGEFGLSCEAMSTREAMSTCEAVSNGIFIRDCYYNYDCLYELEKFDVKLKTRSYIPVSALKFFLKYIFGFDSFRTGQLEAVRKILKKEDSLVLLPTGLGKSVIYQLASYLVPGMIIVVSPLRSLINDQLTNLDKRYGINNAAGIISGVSSAKNDNLRCNAVSLLYISPERVQMPSFRDEINIILQKNNICTVAIDEAHCISEWGHDFRPSYLMVGLCGKPLFSSGSCRPSFVALTGTASEKVRNDIKRALSIKEKSVVYPGSFERKELNFSVIKCRSDEKADNIAYLIRNEIPGCFDFKYDDLVCRNGDKTNCGIVFTPFTKGKQKEYAADSIEARLLASMDSMAIRRYHSKAPKGWENETWDAYIAESARMFGNNEANLLVATKAFGMGIDKGNIRYTIHDGFPQSIESFYQEAGRAGRDGKAAQCIVVFSNDGESKNSQLLNSSLSLEALKQDFENDDYKDDLYTQLFFHTGNFRGVDAECETINKLLGLLKWQTGKGNVSISLNAKQGDKYFFTEKETADNGTAVANALIRLMTLGIVSDYKYQYPAKGECFGKYSFSPGSCERESIDRQFLKYIKSFNAADVPVQEKKLKAVKGNSDDAIRQLIRLMIEYSYSQIELGRRSQLRSMYELMVNVADKDNKEQDKLIKDDINRYFALPNLDDPVSLIVNSEDMNTDIVLKLFDFDNPKSLDSSDMIEKARDIIGRANSALDSGAASRSDLILLKCAAQLVSGVYKKKLLAADMVAAYSFGKAKYRDSLDEIWEIIMRLCNYIIPQSIELFDMFVDEYSNRNKIKDLDFLKEISESEFISDESRDNIALDYYRRSVRHLL